MLCALAAGPGRAQQAPAKGAAAPAEPAPAEQPAPARSRRRLTSRNCCGLPKSWARSPILRDLCGAHDADAFHAKMASLLETEAKTDARKESLAGAYNGGFRGYQINYRVCTPAAREIIARFLDEAARISSDVANRYGG